MISQEETRKLVVSMAAVTEATREIARTTDSQLAREVICSAACTITGARFAKLMERGPDGDLVMTANYGLQGSPPLKVSLDGEVSGAATAFLTKKPLFVADARGDETISQRVVQATGAVSMHFEPVLRNEEAVAVLVVGWNREVDGTGRIAASMRMLAAETAMALERSDLLARLEENARTDDLTGLLNRRAWEEELPRDGLSPAPERPALRGDARPRLLQELQRRARSPGRRPAPQAERRGVGERAARERHAGPLRGRGVHRRPVGLQPEQRQDDRRAAARAGAMPAGQTVSAGVACWNGRESAEELVGRADAALYEAKRLGRDRLETAGGTPPGELKSAAL